MRYTIKVSTEQARILRTALELYSRMGCGQLDYAAHVIPGLDTDRLIALREGLHKLEPLVTGLPPNAHIGIRQAAEPLRIAYDLYRVLEHRMYWDAPGDKKKDGFLPVWADEPWRCSKTEELAEIKGID